MLGTGGQSVVWAAVDRRDGRPVAVKAAAGPAASGAGFSLEAPGARLRREAAVLARVSSPHVVALVEAGEDPELGFCLVLQVVPGVPLVRLLRDGRGLPVRDALAVVEQVALGLRAIHAAGYVVRDLAAGQVLVQRDGARLNATLVDLGLARGSQSESRLTDPGRIAGTPGSTAPEVASGSEIGPSADVYSLAALAWTMLSGKAPFGAAGAEAAYALQLAGHPGRLEALEGLGPEAAIAVENVLRRGLDVLPENRPADPVELARMLAAAVETTGAGLLARVLSRLRRPGRGRG